MSDERIDPDVVEAVKLQWRILRGHDADEERFIEAAIRAADEKRGLREEYREAMIGPVNGPWVPATRLVSDWRPVEEAQGA